jgi:hypothetical protein
MAKTKDARFHPTRRTLFQIGISTLGVGLTTASTPARAWGDNIQICPYCGCVNFSEEQPASDANSSRSDSGALRQSKETGSQPSTSRDRPAEGSKTGIIYKYFVCHCCGRGFRA